MKKKRKKQLISTGLIQETNERVTILQKNLPKILYQKFWQKRIKITEKCEYIKELANAKMNLWQAIKREYPETIGKNFSVDSTEVKIINN